MLVNLLPQDCEETCGCIFFNPGGRWMGTVLLWELCTVATIVNPGGNGSGMAKEHSGPPTWCAAQILKEAEQPMEKTVVHDLSNRSSRLWNRPPTTGTHDTRNTPPLGATQNTAHHTHRKPPPTAHSTPPTTHGAPHTEAIVHI